MRGIVVETSTCLSQETSRLCWRRNNSSLFVVKGSSYRSSSPRLVSSGWKYYSESTEKFVVEVAENSSSVQVIPRTLKMTMKEIGEKNKQKQ